MSKHFFTTNYFKKNYFHLKNQEILRHKSIETTEIYMQVSKINIRHVQNSLDEIIDIENI